MRATTVLLLLVCVLAWPLAAQSDEPETSDSERFLRYGERPLRGDDFLAAVPEKRPVEDPRAEAYSHTFVRYEYQYRSSRQGGKHRVELSKITFHAVFDREQSWNAFPDHGPLLEHHNGHFDIAQIGCLEIQVDWNKRLKQDKLVGTGSSLESAVKDLEYQITDRLRGHEVALQREHEYFDQATRYGTDEKAEQRARQRQRDRLKELEEMIRP